MIDEYATIAISSQAKVCDNRVCDNRTVAVQEGMDRGAVIAWMQRRGLNNRQLAELLGISEDKVSKSLSDHGKPRQWQGPEVLRLVELMAEDEPLVKTEVRGTGMSSAQVRDALAMRGNVKPVPLLGTALGGAFSDMDDVEMTELRLSEILDYLARPSDVADDEEAYALEIVGESMVPRFEPGERVYVSPKATVRPNDDVIVQLVDPNAAGDAADAVTEVLIKRFVRRTANFVELKQYNPEQTFQVPLDRVARIGGRLAIHRVKVRI